LPFGHQNANHLQSYNPSLSPFCTASHGQSSHASSQRLGFMPGTSPKWPCHYDGCNKSYRRRGEVNRHIKDKHEIPRKCFICGIKWTRAYMIRKHLLFGHPTYFIEEERQEIGCLEGPNNTIDFLEKWRITRPQMRKTFGHARNDLAA
jgi:hypothetical protein